MKRLIAVAALVGMLAASAVAIAAGTSPTVSTGTASGLTNTSATVAGTVNPNGEATTYAFQYGTTAFYGQQTTPASAGAGTTPQNVTANITGLTPGTVYHFRVVATNASGTSAGADATFKTTGTAPTPTTPPVVTTGGSSNVKRNTATLAGTVNPEGSGTTYSIEYGLTAFYGVQTTPKSLPGDKTAHSISANLSGLQAGQTYHYRVVATNAGGTSVGVDRMFTTGPPRSTPGISLAVNPKRARTLPRRFNARGSLTLPSGVTANQGCKGTVLVAVRRGKKIVAQKRVHVRSNCRYSWKPRLSGLKKGRVKFTARFGGNAFLSPVGASPQSVRIG